MNRESLKIEYLVFIDTGNAFCADINAFNSLLQSNSKIRIDNNQMIFRDLKIEYKVNMQNSTKESEKFFHVILECNDIQKIGEFEDLLRLIRDILYKVCKTDQLQKLWDDVSYYYSCRAYPLINELENLMRKLITKFMLTNVGLAWAKHSTPKEVRDSVRGTNSNGSIDYLYNIDFIQLSDYLFRPYSSQSNVEMFNKLREAKEITDLKLDDMKTYIPKSNWERYFSDLVQCEAAYLEKKWQKLYELRNKVAHNNFVNKNDYEEISNNCKEVKKIIEEAIQILDQVQIPEEDKEFVAENIGDHRTSSHKLLEVYYDIVESTLAKIIYRVGEETPHPIHELEDLVEINILDINTVNDIKRLSYNLKTTKNIDKLDLDLAINLIFRLQGILSKDNLDWGN
ncbi:HEPN domain-containing protein, partial [Bacillus subtilis]